MRKGAQSPKRRQGSAFFTRPVQGLYEACTRPVRGLYEKHFYFKMLITFEPNVAQRSVASQNDHKSKACLPEASNTASTMYRCLKRRLRRLYEAPFLATFFLAPHSSILDPQKVIFGDFIFFGHFPIEIPIEAEIFLSPWEGVELERKQNMF